VAAVNRQIAELATLSLAQLRAAWRRLHKGQSMPDGLGRDLATRALAWRIQEQRHGGLSPAHARELGRLAAQLTTAGDLDLANCIKLKPGTRLVRQWHERSYHVLVLDEGYEHEGRFFKSLTHIARDITGATRSGPRFFGLKTKGGGDGAPA
jgi:Protein of unknown function (DUF2924)